VHASGRSSGVVHAGIYYAADSLKARFCVEGAALLAEYCERSGLPLARTGKVLLPVDPAEEAQIEGLAARAKANGAAVEVVDQKGLAAIEPAAAPAKVALWSPRTATVDPGRVVRHLAAEVAALGVDVKLGTAVWRVDADEAALDTSRGSVRARFVINAAGAFADRIAQQWGLGHDYVSMPFRGAYREVDPGSGLALRAHVYPVPDARQPFLGVHFTKAVSGKIYVGPTALPALGREHYGGLGGADWGALPGHLARLGRMYVENRQGLRSLVQSEVGRLSTRGLWNVARRLVPSLKPEHLLATGKVGIRAQLFKRETRELVMDYVVERDGKSVHVLNAVSPGFTTAFAMARHLVDSIDL
jgi:L-2-hydroxyglutarate oxidase LhgO